METNTHKTVVTYIVHIILAGQLLWFLGLGKLEERPYREQRQRLRSVLLFIESQNH